LNQISVMALPAYQVLRNRTPPWHVRWRLVCVKLLLLLNVMFILNTGFILFAVILVRYWVQIENSPLRKFMKGFFTCFHTSIYFFYVLSSQVVKDKD
jgi:hypothetical protein